MNILFPTIINLENLESSSLYSDLINCLVEHGHHVTLLTTRERKLKKKTEVYEKKSVTIVAVKSGNLFNINKIEKGISNVLISLQFKNAYKKYIKDCKFDLILYVTPPVTLANFIKFVKNKTNAKTYLMLKDIWPQGPIDIGAFDKYKFMIPYFKSKEKKLYSISDKIGCMSQGNIDYLIKKENIEKPKLEIFYNSIKIENQKEICIDKDCDSPVTTFIFGGNISIPQNISGLLTIINKLETFKYAKFYIIGNGTQDYLIKEYIEKVKPSNLEYSNFLEKTEYDKRLEMADVGLISLDPRFTIPNIPSKLPYYMKLKKPVLALTDSVTDLKDIIIEADCGWWSPSDNVDQCVEVIKKISLDKKEQIEKGQKGYQYLCDNFDVENNVKQLEFIIEGNLYE